MAAVEISIAPFLNKLNAYVLNPIILLVFVIAFLVFMIGILQFVNSASDDNQRKDSKKRIMYGLLGMFIMFSAYGIISLILSTFGISNPEYISF
jgi:hypothetical protein